MIPMHSTEQARYVGAVFILPALLTAPQDVPSRYFSLYALYVISPQFGTDPSAKLEMRSSAAVAGAAGMPQVGALSRGWQWHGADQDSFARLRVAWKLV